MASRPSRASAIASSSAAGVVERLAAVDVRADRLLDRADLERDVDRLAARGDGLLPAALEEHDDPARGERGRLDLARADTACDLDGLVDGRHRLHAATAQHEQPRVRLEGDSALGGRLGRHQLDGAPGGARGLLAPAGRPQVARNAHVQIGEALGIVLGLKFVERAPHERDRAGAARRPSSPRRRRAGRSRCGRAPADPRGARPQHLEGTLEVALSLGVGVDALGLLARAHGRRQRELELVGGVPVEGELGGGRAARQLRAGLELARQGELQRLALAREHVGVGGLAQELVAEFVGALARGDEHHRGHGLSEGEQRAGLGKAGHRGEQRWSTRRPAAAATRKSCWAGADRGSSRTSSASRSEAGSSPTPSEPATSSSVKNALPSERA